MAWACSQWLEVVCELAQLALDVQAMLEAQASRLREMVAYCDLEEDLEEGELVWVESRSLTALVQEMHFSSHSVMVATKGRI